MYVTDHPDQHKGRKPKAPDTVVAKPEEINCLMPICMTLQTKMEEVMCTNLYLSLDDVNALFAKAGVEN